MQRQSRKNNNPANPLLKIAALSINRKYEIINKHASFCADVKLNFKRSNDIRGHTIDRDGNEITVNFCLSVRKATLELRFGFEKTEDEKAVLITKVAFVESLSTDRSFAYTEEVKATNETEGLIEAGVAVSAHSVSLPSIKAKTKLKARGGKSNSYSRTRKANEKYKITGITGTYAGNEINWSIDALWTRNEDVHSGYTSNYLSGEVFKDPASGKPIYACRVSWNHKDVSSAMEIHGSVRVMMQDLIIEDISFFDKFGAEQKWSAISKINSDDNKIGLIGTISLDRDEFKRRLVRQIIRKHLASQGMDLQGASVEISSARG